MASRRRAHRRTLNVLLVLSGLLLVPGWAVAQMNTGSYVGDGTGSRSISGVGFRPDVVIIKGDSTQGAVIRTVSMTGNVSKPLVGPLGLSSGMIQSLDADGFTLGSDTAVNGLVGATYYWTAFKANTNLAVGSYTGNGNTVGDSQAIAGLGFRPVFLITLPAQGRWALHRTSLATTLSLRFDGSGYPINDAIPSLDP